MHLLWYFLTLGAVLCAPVALAVERSGSQVERRNTPIDVQLETINTLTNSITQRLTSDIIKELPNDDRGRIFRELERLKVEVDLIEAEFDAIRNDPTKIGMAAEVDPHACAFAKRPIPTCTTTTHRLVFNGTDWECVARAAWEQ